MRKRTVITEAKTAEAKTAEVKTEIKDITTKVVNCLVQIKELIEKCIKEIKE